MVFRAFEAGGWPRRSVSKDDTSASRAENVSGVFGARSRSFTQISTVRFIEPERTVQFRFLFEFAGRA